MNPILSARDVRKVYRTGTQEVEALRDVSLDIMAGEMVMVMGPSGNGKTTMLNCLSGLDDIDNGTVFVDGEEIHSMSDARRTEHRAQRMGFVFQSFNLIPVFTAIENVELPLLVTGVKAKEARERAQAIMERVELGDRTGHRPTELSGGEQQRVAIARALVSEPAIVWADEPTGNLDSQTTAEIMTIIARLHREEGLTVVLVTHEPDVAAWAERVITFRDGLVVSDVRKDSPRRHAVTEELRLQ